MMQELMRMVERSEEEPRDRQLRRISARHLRARQREQRRTEAAIMEIAWSRLC